MFLYSHCDVLLHPWFFFNFHCDILLHPRFLYFLSDVFLHPCFFFTVTSCYTQGFYIFTVTSYYTLGFLFSLWRLVTPYVFFSLWRFLPSADSLHSSVQPSTARSHNKYWPLTNLHTIGSECDWSGQFRPGPFSSRSQWHLPGLRKPQNCNSPWHHGAHEETATRLYQVWGEGGIDRQRESE